MCLYTPLCPGGWGDGWGEANARVPSRGREGPERENTPAKRPPYYSDSGTNCPAHGLSRLFPLFINLGGEIIGEAYSKNASKGKYFLRDCGESSSPAHPENLTPPSTPRPSPSWPPLALPGPSALRSRRALPFARPAPHARPRGPVTGRKPQGLPSPAAGSFAPASPGSSSLSSDRVAEPSSKSRRRPFSELLYFSTNRKTPLPRDPVFSFLLLSLKKGRGKKTCEGFQSHCLKTDLVPWRKRKDRPS